MTAEAAARRRVIADALRAYLRVASALTTVPPESECGSEGWVAAAPDPQGQEYGRDPWTSMRNIEVGAVGATIVVSFDWDRQDGQRVTYAVPMAAPDWDVVTGADALITRLDLLLDVPDWQIRAHPLGGNVYLVVPPDKR